MNFSENSEPVEDSTFNALSIKKEILRDIKSKIDETSFHPKLRFK
jgi:hypothetical protein